jgi:hypothetical protein
MENKNRENNADYVKALAVLTLEPGVSAETIEKRFNELYSDMQIRLTNAPTPNLKKLYQKNLQELEDAFAFLTVGAKVSNDLPSARPSIVNDRDFVPPPRVQPTVQANSKTQKASTKKSGPTPALIAGYALAILFLAATVLVFNMYSKSGDEIGKLKGELEMHNKKADLYKYLENGKLKVRNVGDKPIKIVSYIVNYVDDNFKVKKFIRRELEIIIKPGQTRPFDCIEDSETRWDGRVVSFSLEIAVAEKYGIVGGMWWDVAGKEGVYSLNF